MIRAWAAVAKFSRIVFMLSAIYYINITAQNKKKMMNSYIYLLYYYCRVREDLHGYCYDTDTWPHLRRHVDMAANLVCMHTASSVAKARSSMHNILSFSFVFPPPKK